MKYRVEYFDDGRWAPSNNFEVKGKVFDKEKAQRLARKQQNLSLAKLKYRIVPVNKTLTKKGTNHRKDTFSSKAAAEKEIKAQTDDCEYRVVPLKKGTQKCQSVVTSCSSNTQLLRVGTIKQYRSHRFLLWSEPVTTQGFIPQQKICRRRS